MQKKDGCTLFLWGEVDLMDTHTTSRQDHTLTLLIEPKRSCYGLRPTAFARLFPHLGQGRLTLPVAFEC